MKLVIIDSNNKARINKIVEWIIYMLGYTISFILISLIFRSFQINNEHMIIYSFMAVVIIYFLNKTVRPIILKLTMPLMGITVGLFYFVINAGILKAVDIIMGNKLDFTEAWQLFVIAILLAATNAIIEELILKPIVRRFKKR